MAQTAGAISRAMPVKHADVATWVASSDAVALSTGTAGATTLSMGYLFHPATLSMKIELLAAQLSWAAGAGAGDAIKVKLARITAENGAPGGTVNNCAPHDSRDNIPDPTTALVARFGATGAPTGRVILATHTISHATPGSLDLADLMRQFSGKLPLINSDTAEGLEVLIVTGAAGPATAAALALTFKFTARRTA